MALLLIGYRQRNWPGYPH